MKYIMVMSYPETEKENNKYEYITPLVRNNRLEVLKNIEDTIDATNLDVFLYLRVSTRKEDQATSIPNQEKFLREWCKMNGYNVVGIFKDTKTGAYIDGRDEFKNMLEGLKNGKARGVIVKEVSRASRDLEELLRIKRKISDANAFLICVNINYDSRIHKDNFLFQIYGAIAEKERTVTSERVKIVQIMKAKEGKTNVPSPAFGYKLSEDKQYLVIDNEKAPIYKIIVEKFLEGWGQLKICQYLNSKGYKPPKRGKKWCTNTIKTILTNPVYIGRTIYNTTTIKNIDGKAVRFARPKDDWIIVDNTHEPLITKEKFEKIQYIIEERRKKDKKEWTCSKKYFLSGMLYCDVCGEKVYGSRQPSRKKKRNNNKLNYYYYYVDQNRSGRCDTKSKYWNMEKVDDIVIQELKNFFSDRRLVEERIRAKQYLYNKDMEEEKKKRDKLIGDLESVRIAKQRVMEAYERRGYSYEEMVIRKNSLEEEEANIRKKIFDLDNNLKKADMLEERYQEIRDKVMTIIDNLDKLNFETKEALMKKIIKRIYIRKDYSIRIEYVFDE